MKEVWKPVVGYEGLYEVSDHGKVKSLPRTYYQRESHKTKGKVLSQHTTSFGYLQTSLRKNNKKNSYLVHRLVADAFIENPTNKPEVNHVDCDKKNNHVSNLEWVSSKENIKHALINGLANKAKGEKHAHSKLTEKQVKEIKKHLSEGQLYESEIAEIYGVTQTNINTIKRNKAWTHIEWPENKSAKGKRYMRKETAIKIKKMLFIEGVSVKEISEKVGVSKDAIYKIRNGDNWTGVEYRD